MDMIVLSSNRVTRENLPAHSKPNDQPATASGTDGNLFPLAQDIVDHTAVQQTLLLNRREMTEPLPTRMLQRTNDVAPTEPLEPH